MELFDNNSAHSKVSEKVSTCKAYTIGGVSIVFPYRAYPSQITMMDKIIKCLNKRQNCLLESPTGSGKSLALLCASLAWQNKIRKEIDKQERELENELNAYGTTIPDGIEIGVEATKWTKDDMESKPENSKDSLLSKVINKISRGTKDSQKGVIFLGDSKSAALDSTKVEFPNHVKSPIACPVSKIVPNIKNLEVGNTKRGIVYFDDDDDSEDFQPVKKYRCSMDSTEINLQNTSYTSEYPSPRRNSDSSCSKIESPRSVESTASKACGSDCCDSTDVKGKTLKGTERESSVPLKLPRIYYGTRTHKQIEQIIRELKKTPYKNSKMTILSSRERTCIHPEASCSSNKNEACDDLIKADGGPACQFYRNSKTVSHYHPSKLSSAFDLEDLVKTCKRIRACPYFGSRELLLNSDVVFCPYNYLIDPLIRSAMSITLKGNIIITDEAHNIEDSARDAASGSLSLSQLEGCVIDLEKVGRHSKTIPDFYKSLAKTLSNLVGWLKLNIHNLTDYTTFDSSAKVWEGDTMIGILNLVELGPESFPEFKKKFEKVLAEETDTDKEAIIDMDKPKLLGSTLQYLKSLTQILSYIFKENLIFVPDYRCVVMKSKISPPNSKKLVLTSNPFQVTLNFWCLNPAVAFSDFKGLTHSVIVASGTLSPLTSFQSELGIPFPITLEANHVISKSQLWVGTIGKGPDNNSLTATYHNAATFAFQDDVGKLVYQVCCAIPHGILCFLPSYSMLDRLMNRWQQTGMWDRLLSRKVVLCEPRRQHTFTQVITEFYDAVKQTEDSASPVNGALFLAICRGKVSEGLDFADNNARAVITIGIPFPNIKDAQVDLKRKYNDMYSSKKNIMSGSEWYEIQAFRALNQALGRCIRHREDFGALIIVDERFQKNHRYPEALSKWIRKEIVHYPSFSSALSSLNTFAENTGMNKTTDEELSSNKFEM